MTANPPPASVPGAPVPPPPPSVPGAPGAGRSVTVPPVGWLLPLAAVLALIGAFLAWFEPYGTIDGKREYQGETVLQGEALHAWDDGKVGLIGPIFLVIVGGVTLLLLLGKTAGRAGRSANPVASSAKQALAAGAIAVAAAAVAWFLLPSQYKIDLGLGRKLSWDDAIKVAKESGFDMEISRGPQLGFWLTVAAAILALIGGALLLMQARNGGQTMPPAQPGAAQQPYTGPAQPQQPYTGPAQPQQPYTGPAQPQQPYTPPQPPAPGQ